MTRRAPAVLAHSLWATASEEAAGSPGARRSPLSTRNERGEGQGEGFLFRGRDAFSILARFPLSPALSPFLRHGEREARRPSSRSARFYIPSYGWGRRYGFARFLPPSVAHCLLVILWSLRHWPLGISRATILPTLLLTLSLPAAEIETSKLPPPSDQKIDFTRDVKPILEQACLKCHGPEKPKSKFRLDNRQAALKGGENHREDIVPGQSAKSPLIHYVAGLDEEMMMPPPGKGPPLARDQIALLRAWIDQGVAWETNPPPPKAEFTLVPGLEGIAVSGNESVFREQSGKTAGLNGASYFELKEKIGDRAKSLLEGHVLRDDYRAAVTIEREELGFVRFGAQQYRKYFSDTGGYDPLNTPPAFSSDRDLHLDIGSAWVDFGLALPDWPRLTLGYEYQYKRGEKSTLQWGAVTNGIELSDPTYTRARNILPASKEIDERVHILKFDLEHDVKGVRIEDSFRGEWYDSATRRTNYSFNLNGGTFTGQDIREGYRHFQGANSLRLEKQVLDWLFVSGGYLYSKLSADASFNLDQINGGATGQQWRSQPIILERESHVVNPLNVLFGPWDGLTLSAGVQTEWTRQKGFGGANIVFPGLPDPYMVSLHSDLDKTALQESVGLRYTKIPFTVLFADARFAQESIGQYEDQVSSPSPINDFRRNTDADSDLKDFRVGFNTSPWRRISFSAHYRRLEKDNHYNHFLDSTYADYSAFIRSLARSSDEVETKLAVHPATWLKATFGVKWVETRYHTATDPVPGDMDPGRRLLAGTYEALIPSLNLTLMPLQRLYLSTTFTYQDSRTVTMANDSPSVVPYRGHVYSALTSGTYAWDARTDLRLSYSFSHADYGQSNFAYGLPVGMVYQRHWVQAGLSRRFLRNLTGNLQYGFSLYDEPSTGHFNDYTAHAVFASLTMNWP